MPLDACSALPPAHVVPGPTTCVPIGARCAGWALVAGGIAALVILRPTVFALVSEMVVLMRAGVDAPSVASGAVAVLALCCYVAVLTATPVGGMALFFLAELVVVGPPRDIRASARGGLLQIPSLALATAVWPVLLLPLYSADHRPPLVISPHALPAALQPFASVAIAIAAMLATDFVGYWLHRAYHGVPLLWRFHAVHHAIENLDALNSWTHPLEGLVERFVLLVLFQTIGFDAEQLLLIVAFSIVHGAVIHTRVPINTGWLGVALIDNRHHFEHHRRDTPKARNFGVRVSLWDRLFGTYAAPKPGPLPATGLREAVPASRAADLFLARLHPREPVEDSP